LIEFPVAAVERIQARAAEAFVLQRKSMARGASSSHTRLPQIRLWCAVFWSA